MSDPLNNTLSALAGLVLGTIFFGGLWWTIHRGFLSKRPLLWLFGSLIVRMSAVLICFYWIGKDDWKRLIATLIGFILARFAVIWITRKVTVEKEALDAS